MRSGRRGRRAFAGDVKHFLDLRLRGINVQLEQRGSDFSFVENAIFRVFRKGRPKVDQSVVKEPLMRASRSMRRRRRQRRRNVNHGISTVFFITTTIPNVNLMYATVEALVNTVTILINGVSPTNTFPTAL